MKLSGLKAPDTFFLIFLLTIIVAALTWIIPGGKYQTAIIDGKERVLPESFQFVERNPQNIDDVLIAPIRGFVDAALVIGFVLLVGGAFAVFQKTEAVNAAIKGIAKAHNRHYWLQISIIPLFMILFSLGGAIFGMSEEVIPFILIFVPLALTLGYDSITGVAIPFIGAGAGFAGAFLNPFTIGVAQGIADVPLFSGLEYRFLVWSIITGIAIVFVVIYARRIRKNPRQSPTFETDEKKRSEFRWTDGDEFGGLNRRHKRVLIVFAFGIIVLVFGVLKYHWYIEEISAVFIFTGIAVGIAGRLQIREITGAFVSGAKDLVATALIIALARGILIIAQQGQIIDTILFYLSNLIRVFHPVMAAVSMFFAQTLVNFFIPSGSGQAALTMPIMAPLSDLVQVSRQTAVLAFQFGDGFSNMIIPTSAVTMGVLTLAEIPWEKWAKWILPLQVIFFIVGSLLLIPPFFFKW